MYYTLFVFFINSSLPGFLLTLAYLFTMDLLIIACGTTVELKVLPETTCRISLIFLEPA